MDACARHARRRQDTAREFGRHKNSLHRRAIHHAGARCEMSTRCVSRGCQFGRRVRARRRRRRRVIPRRGYARVRVNNRSPQGAVRPSASIRRQHHRGVQTCSPTSSITSRAPHAATVSKSPASTKPLNPADSSVTARIYSPTPSPPSPAAASVHGARQPVSSPSTPAPRAPTAPRRVGAGAGGARRVVHRSSRGTRAHAKFTGRV